MVNWRAVMAQVNLPLDFLLQADESTFLWATEKLQKGAVLARRVVLHGACLAAREALQELRAQEAAGQDTPHFVCVEKDAARQAFNEANRDKVGIEELQEVFRPVAILLDESLRGNRCGFLFLDDPSAPERIIKALTAVAAVRREQLRALGEVHLVPPALASEGRVRRRWIDARLGGSLRAWRRLDHV